MSELEQFFRQLPADKRIFAYGAGSGGVAFNALLNAYCDKSISGFIDSSESTEKAGHRVFSVSEFAKT